MRKAAAAELRRARNACGEEPSPLPSPLSSAEEGRAGFRRNGQHEEETKEARQHPARSSHRSRHKHILGIRYSRSTLAHSPPSRRGGGLVLHATATAAATVDPRIRLPTLVHTTMPSHRQSSGSHSTSSTRPRPRAAVEGGLDGSGWLRRAMHVMMAMP